MKITTEKLRENEALKLYSNLIIPDIAALEKTKCKCKNKSDTKRNLESVFIGLYLHYGNVSELESEPKFKENIAERTKLRTQEFSKQPDTTDMYDSESKESTDQERLGIKILTPSQMFSQLTISLSQLKAENDSEKFKNKIRQLLYYL